MTTYLQLQEKVARAIQDPDNETFGTQTIKDVIAAAWQEISRVAPERYTEDITPVTDTLEYQLRADVFTDPNDSIELVRVELWDVSDTLHVPIKWFTPKGSHPSGLSYSQTGWEVWGGMLRLTNDSIADINVTDHAIRVWGYSPWEMPVADEDVIAINAELEEAVVVGCLVYLLRRLTNNRALFTAWQTRSNNTDVSMASLMNDYESAKDDWRRMKRDILVAREGV